MDICGISRMFSGQRRLLMNVPFHTATKIIKNVFFLCQNLSVNISNGLSVYICPILLLFSSFSLLCFFCHLFMYLFLYSDEGLTLETSANTLFTAFSISTSTLRWYIVRFIFFLLFLVFSCLFSSLLFALSSLHFPSFLFLFFASLHALQMAMTSLDWVFLEVVLQWRHYVGFSWSFSYKMAVANGEMFVFLLVFLSFLAQEITGLDNGLAKTPPSKKILVKEILWRAMFTVDCRHFQRDSFVSDKWDLLISLRKLFSTNITDKTLSSTLNQIRQTSVAWFSLQWAGWHGKDFVVMWTVSTTHTIVSGTNYLILKTFKYLPNCLLFNNQNKHHFVFQSISLY